MFLTSDPLTQPPQIKPKRKPPLYLNLSDFKLIRDVLISIQDDPSPDGLSVEELELKHKCEKIISYIERARLRSRGDSQ